LKAVSLLSGGIDSPVAAYLMLKTGYDITLLHMDNRPYADDDAWKKAGRLRERLEHVTGKKIDLFSAPHGPSQRAFSENCRKNLQCVMCKRAMVRAAERVAGRIGAGAVITGDSLGQVASQTLQNLRVVEAAVKIPIIRPLVGLDKTEIIEIARKIGTFELSTMPGVGCTAVPDKPATRAALDSVLAEESKVDIECLVGSAVRDMTVVDR
jgi:thiamine biosynthesis protein ThiI